MKANGSAYTGTISPNTSGTEDLTLTLDNTAPTLTSGTAGRISDTEALIGFTTNEPGTAYYKVVTSGAPAPTFTVGDMGTSLGHVSGTVSVLPVDLTAGPQDIYVVEENWAGYITTPPLLISAAAYSASTPPVITTPPSDIPNGTVDLPYSVTLAATNSPTTWTASGQPAWLTIDNSGVLSGTPTAAGGPFTFTVTAANSYGVSATVTYTINIDKGTRAAPTGLTATNVSASGATDGAINGVTTEMAYADPSWNVYPCPNSSITGLGAGLYYVHYVETADYYESDWTKVMITEPAVTAGDFKITLAGGSYTYTSNTLLLTGDGGYIISMATSGSTTTTDNIVVDTWVSAEITLDGVSIDLSGPSGAGAFEIMEDAEVRLTLEGANTLKSGDHHAGLYVGDGRDLYIYGSGTIDAYGGLNGAGIGGADETGYEPTFGYLEIYGGTVNATGGANGAGIGGGTGGYGGDAWIIGGSVQSIGDASLEVTAYNYYYDPIYLDTLTVGSPAVAGNTPITAGEIDGVSCRNENIYSYYYYSPTTPGEYLINDVVTDAAGKVYFWLPSSGSDKSISLTAGGTVYSNANVPDGACSATLVVPLPVTNTGGSATVTYSGTTINLPAVSGLYTIDPNAGAPVYTIVGGTGSGSIANDSILTVTAAGTFDLELTTAATATHLAGATEPATLTVNKGTQAAPSGLTTTAETSLGAADGKISNVTTDMEYKLSSAGSYTTVSADPETGLAAGVYDVRYKATALYEAGLDTQVIVTSPPASAGDFTITLAGGNYSYTSNTLTIASNGTFVISMATPGDTTYTDRIVVPSGITANIILDNVSIDLSATAGACAFEIAPGSYVTVNLQGSNEMVSGDNRAGIYVPSGASLTIDGSGTLEAVGGDDGAGIGGTNDGGVSDPDGGSVTINGGTITATGGGGGAGIGGGYNGDGGSVSITGGTVTATSAVGAGIGSGDGGSVSGSLTITGGSVDINGGGGTEATPTNDGSTPVYLVTLTVGSSSNANTAITAGEIDGTACVTNTPNVAAGEYGINGVSTDAGGNVYFWLPDLPVGTDRSVELTAGGVVYSSTTVPAAASNSNTATLASALPPAVLTTAPAPATLTYNGSAQALVSAGAATGGTIEYSTVSGGPYATTIPTGTNAGSYTVYYIVTGDGSHSSLAEASVTVTIAKKTVTVTAPSVSVTQDDPLPALPAIVYSGWVSPDNEGTALTTTAVAQYNVANSSVVGTSAIDFATQAVLTPAASANYTLTHVNGTLTVTAAGTTPTPTPTPTTRQVELVVSGGFATNPAAGTSYIQNGSDFYITITPPASSPDLKPVVTTSRNVADEVSLVYYTSSNTWLARVPAVRSNITVYVKAYVPPTGNADVASTTVRVWATAGDLHIISPEASTVQVYTLTGTLIVTRPLQPGETVIPLKKGIHIVKVGDTVKKITTLP